MTTDSPDSAPTAPGSAPVSPPPVPAAPPMVPAPHPHANPAQRPPITLLENIAPPNAEERNTGMLIHLLAIFTGWLVPLLLVAGILALIREIQACTAASRGKCYCDPFSFRLIR